MDGKHKGIEIRPSGRLRIHFRYRGKSCKEPLDVPASSQGIKYASRLLADIKAQIRAGIFDYGATFPKSKEAAETLSLAQYADRWLALQEHLAESTKAGYKSSLKVVTDRFGHLSPHGVTASALGQAMVDHGWKSVKARNNAITPIRGMFELCVLDGVIKKNPADILKFAKYQRDDPDPLDPDEVSRLLEWLRVNRDEMLLNYFSFAISTGMRTSELLGLEWGDIDFRKQIARVHQVNVQGRHKKQTKTAKVRDVELLLPAIEALQRQKKHTFLQGGRIFHDPLTRRPFVDDKPPRLVWNAALKALGIRHRVAYQTRHTSVCMKLMAGANPSYVAAQHGHSLETMFRTYAKWIPSADKGRQRALLNGEHSGNISGKTGTNQDD